MDGWKHFSLGGQLPAWVVPDTNTEVTRGGLGASAVAYGVFWGLEVKGGKRRANPENIGGPAGKDK